MTYLSGALKKFFGANDRLRAIHLREDPTYSIVVWKSRLRRQLRIYTPFLPELRPVFKSRQLTQEIKNILSNVRIITKQILIIINLEGISHNSHNHETENQSIHG